LSETTRTIVSLLLFVHLFCLFVVLSANLVPSPLQRQLVSAVATYARLLNFDPNFTRYHLTHGVEDDDDHFVEVSLAESPDAPLARLPAVGLRSGLRSRRYQTLAAALAFYASREVDSVSAEFAKAIGAYVIRQHNASRVVVRCRWHRSLPLAPEQQGASGSSDPFDASLYETVYEADVWLEPDGSVQVLKKSSPREVAPAVRETS
jgi:hypothetical protein